MLRVPSNKGGNFRIFANMAAFLFKIADFGPVHMRKYIMRRSEPEGGRPPASRRNLKSIEICFNSSNHGKIEVYLDRIH